MTGVEQATKCPPPLDLTRMKVWPETTQLQQALDAFGRRLDADKVPTTRAKFLEIVRAMACYGVLARQCDCPACDVAMDAWIAEYDRWETAGSFGQAPELPPYMYPYHAEPRNNGVTCSYVCPRSGAKDRFTWGDTVPLTDVPLDPEA